VSENFTLTLQAGCTRSCF